MSEQPASSAALPPGEAITERRRVPRHSAAITVRLRSSYGEEAEVALTDISIHGCSIRTAAGWLRAGSFVSIGLGEDPLLQAIVRWVRDGASGLEFVHPFSDAHCEWHALTGTDIHG